MLADVVQGIRFKDGIRVTNDAKQEAVRKLPDYDSSTRFDYNSGRTGPVSNAKKNTRIALKSFPPEALRDRVIGITITATTSPAVGAP